MSLERIDPFAREDLYAVDHLLRYDWAASLVDGCRCLDVACGLGFGSLQLRRGGAREVLGVDRDAEAVALSRERWGEEPRLNFREGRMEELSAVAGGGWDRVISFETLEHVEDPEAALRAVKDVLADGGIFVGSVPGETDREEKNDYHLHHFDRESLGDLLGRVFGGCRIFRQAFHAASVLEPEGQAWTPGLDRARREALRVELGDSGPLPDSYVFLAGEGPLPAAEAVRIGFSRAAWRRVWEAGRASGERAEHLQEQFRKLFLENGGLKRRISGLLAWGRFNFQRAQGWTPESGLEDLRAQWALEQEQKWREKVEDLQREVARLREEVAVNERELEAFSKIKRTFFLNSLQEGPDKRDNEGNE